MSGKEGNKERRFSREFKLAALARMATGENVSAEGGFTVIEALVAFAILAGVLGVAYGIYADGLRRAARLAGIS